MARDQLEGDYTNKQTNKQLLYNYILKYNYQTPCGKGINIKKNNAATAVIHTCWTTGGTRAGLFEVEVQFQTRARETQSVANVSVLNRG